MVPVQQPGSPREAEGAAAVRARSLAERHHAAARAAHARSPSPCPSTYQCFAPHHFLWTSWFLPPLVRMFLPQKRPMDDIVAGWDRPQEDEFALMNMGVPSPYLVWAFPNHGPVADEYLDLRTLPTAERETWKRKWRGFVRAHRARRQSPHRVEVAHAHCPRADDPGSLPERPVHSHRARSAGAVSFHCAIVEIAQRSAGLPNPAR